MKPMPQEFYDFVIKATRAFSNGIVQPTIEDLRANLMMLYFTNERRLLEKLPSLGQSPEHEALAYIQKDVIRAMTFPQKLVEELPTRGYTFYPSKKFGYSVIPSFNAQLGKACSHILHKPGIGDINEVQVLQFFLAKEDSKSLVTLSLVNNQVRVDVTAMQGIPVQLGLDGEPGCLTLDNLLTMGRVRLDVSRMWE